MEKNKRVYVFDWDDNIINMPTTIKMERFDGESWELTELSTTEFAELRNSDTIRFPKSIANPYLNFRDNQQFIVDLTKAIDEKDFGPSFPKFKECLMYGNDFAIITARGQSINTILAGIMIIIGKTFQTDEMNTMLNNVDNLNNYLGRQMIFPVSSDEMYYPELEKAGVKDTIELRKVLSLTTYVEKKIIGTKEFEFDGKFSIGISDDDQHNINTIEEYINKALKPKYPQLHFVVYDTSNPDKVIKRPI
jgi:hypothetical protein